MKSALTRPRRGGADTVPTLPVPARLSSRFMRDENGVCPADNEAEHGISARQAADTRRRLGVR
jgi:hypothetical protein